MGDWLRRRLHADAVSEHVCLRTWASVQRNGRLHVHAEEAVQEEEEKEEEETDQEEEEEEEQARESGAREVGGESQSLCKFRPVVARVEALERAVRRYNLPDELLFDGSEGVLESGGSGARCALVLRFTLPSSCYATMALRELLHADTTFRHHYCVFRDLLLQHLHAITSSRSNLSSSAPSAAPLRSTLTAVANSTDASAWPDAATMLQARAQNKRHRRLRRRQSERLRRESRRRETQDRNVEAMLRGSLPFSTVFHLGGRGEGGAEGNAG